MKTVIAALILLLSGSLTKAGCLGEAQLIVPIKSAEVFNYGYCKVFFDPKEVKFFAASQECPLTLQEIAREGIVAGYSNGYECRFELGDEINAIVVKDAKGFFKLK